MTNPSPSNNRKRPRPDPPPASQDEEEDDAIFAFASALSADLAVGKTLVQAVESLFGTIADDLPTANRQRLRNLNLAEPIFSALRSSPELENDVQTIAKMCQTVYDFAEDEIEMLRVPPRDVNLTLSRLSDVSSIIDQADNIVVLTGAGVSVSCGIPDFRSKGGLYDTVLERFGLEDPQAIFDLDEFKMDPTLFYSFAKDVMPSKQIRPSATHRFVAELDRRGKLLRNYSQNIDGLESRAGVSDERLVLCHGSFLTATCMRRSCRASISGDDIATEVAAGIVPICRSCGDQKPQSADEDDDDSLPHAEARGVLKPDIVFFGEKLPRKVGESLEKDIAAADLLLVLGTSLQVAPVARIPQFFKDNVPQILVNREPLYCDFDVELLGNCDAVIHELRKALDWEMSASPDSRESCVTNDSSESTVARDMSGSEKDQESTDMCEFPVIFRPPRRFIFHGASLHAGSDVKRKETSPAESDSKDDDPSKNESGRKKTDEGPNNARESSNDDLDGSAKVSIPTNGVSDGGG